MLTLVETNFRPPYDLKYKCTKVNNNKHKSFILRLYTKKKSFRFSTIFFKTTNIFVQFEYLKLVNKKIQ